MSDEWLIKEISKYEDKHYTYGYIRQVNVKENREGYIIWTITLIKQGQKDSFTYSSGNHDTQKYLTALRGAVNLMVSYEDRRK